MSANILQELTTLFFRSEFLPYAEMKNRKGTFSEEEQYNNSFLGLCSDKEILDS